jgi:hypothetical protein
VAVEFFGDVPFRVVVGVDDHATLNGCQFICDTTNPRLDVTIGSESLSDVT